MAVNPRSFASDAAQNISIYAHRTYFQVKISAQQSFPCHECGSFIEITSEWMYGMRFYVRFNSTSIISEDSYERLYAMDPVY